MKRRFVITAFAVLSLLVSFSIITATPTHAACFNPAGNAGDVIYNGGYRVEQYCNGGSWQKMGGAGDTASGLVGWWKFDDGSGTSAADSSGNGNTGTLTNGPPWTAGMLNGALTFNGTNQYVNLGGAASLAGGSAVTVSAWVKSTGSDGEIVARRDLSQGSMSWELLITGGKARFTNMTSAGSNFDYQVTSGSSISTGVWTHIAGVYTSSDGVLRIYVNGVADGTTIGSGTIAAHSGVKTFVGAYSDASSLPANSFAGTIDDVRVYNRALSASDVMTLYTSTGGTSGDIKTGLIHYWKLDEAPGTTTAADSAGTATLSKTGTVDFTTSGKINNGLSLPSDSTLKYLSAASFADIDGASTLTMSLWFKRATSTSVLEVGGENSGVEQTAVRAQNDGSTVFAVGNNAGTSWASSGAAGAGTAWHLATMVYDGTQTGNANQLKGYIDGVQQTLSFTGPPPAALGTGNTLRIGDAGAGAFPFDAGTIDEVRVYNRALSASDVLTLYNTTATACAGPVDYAGDEIYNADYHVPQFCNGTNWIATGKVPGAGGAGCSSPAGSEGDTMYNKDSRAMQYCDGTNWNAFGGNVPLSGLVGWWNFDEGSGTSAADSSGNGATGTFNGSPLATWTTSGKIGGAVVFDGSNNTIITGTRTYFDQAPFTVSVWVKYNALPSSNANGMTLVEGGISVSPYTVWELYSLGPSNDIVMIVYDSGDVQHSIASNSAVSTGQWYHVVATVDSSYNIKLYINGVQQTATANSGSMYSAATFLNISAYSGGGTFNGTIDDPRVYNRALSASEVWRLYNGAP